MDCFTAAPEKSLPLLLSVRPLVPDEHPKLTDTIFTTKKGGVVDLAALVMPRTYLNDEHLNAFMDILQTHRSQGKILIMSTQFMTLLLGSDQQSYDFSRVKRWTVPKRLKKRAGVEKIFNSGLESVLIPVHAGGIHWWLCAVSIQTGTVFCLDSARDVNHTWDPSRGHHACTAIVRWLNDVEKEEIEAVGGVAPLINERVWQIDLAPTHALQRDPERGGDCGVFTCAAADWWVTATMSSHDDQSDETVERFSTLHSDDMEHARLVIAAVLLEHCSASLLHERELTSYCEIAHENISSELCTHHVQTGRTGSG